MSETLPESSRPSLAAVMLAVVAASGLQAWPMLSGEPRLGDPGELAAVLAEPGVAHPPGYAAYTVLGHLFGSAMGALFDSAGTGPRWFLWANSFSFMWSLAAAGSWAACFWLALPAGPGLEGPSARFRRAWLWGSLACGFLVWATHPNWLRLSVIAEVYAMQGGLLGLFWLLLFLRLRAAAAGSEAPGTLPNAWVALLGVLAGIGCAHHSTFVFALPFGLWIAGRELRRAWAGAGKSLLNSLGFLARGAGGWLLGISCVAYLPLRSAQGPAMNWGRPGDSFQSFLDHVTANQYRHIMGEAGFDLLARLDAMNFTRMESFYTLLALAGGLAAALLLLASARRKASGETEGAPSLADDWRGHAAALLGFHALLMIAFNVAYPIPDIVDYFAPVSWNAGLMLALALSALAPDGDASRERDSLSRKGLPWVAAALLVPPALMARQEAKLLDEVERGLVAKAEKAWRSLPDGPGACLDRDPTLSLFWYLALGEGIRPEIRAFSPDGVLKSPDDFARAMEAFGMAPVLVFDDAAAGERLDGNEQRLALVRNLWARAPMPVHFYDPEADELLSRSGFPPEDPLLAAWKAGALDGAGRFLAASDAREAGLPEVEVPGEIDAFAKRRFFRP